MAVVEGSLEIRMGGCRLLVLLLEDFFSLSIFLGVIHVDLVSLEGLECEVGALFES